MHFWPRDRAVVDKLGEGICGRVFELVVGGGLEVFYTEQGYVNIDVALFVRAADVDRSLRGALDAVGLPVAYLEFQHGWILERVLAMSPLRLLTPRALCDYLRLRDSVKGINAEAKGALLEYILSGIVVSNDFFDMLAGIPLFQLANGACYAVGSDNRRIFICLDEFEEHLFQLRPDWNLDCRLLSPNAVALLGKLAGGGNIPINIYSVDDFVDYCLGTVFPDISEDVDVILGSPEQLQFVDQAWTWIKSKWSGSCAGLKKLWLIPLRGGYLRRAYTERSVVPTLHTLSGSTGQLLLRLATLSQWPTPPPLLDEGVLSTENLEFLVNNVSQTGELLMGSCEDLQTLLPWLVAGKEILHAAADQDKSLMLATIATKFKGDMLTGKVDVSMVAQALKQLSLFERVQSAFVAGRMYTNLFFKFIHSKVYVDKVSPGSKLGHGPSITARLGPS
jgi:hypothetical protein